MASDSRKKPSQAESMVRGKGMDVVQVNIFEGAVAACESWEDLVAGFCMMETFSHYSSEFKA